MTNPNDPRVTILLRRIEKLSLKYHRLSLLFHELHQSIKYQSKSKSFKELQSQIKDIDFKSIIDFSYDFNLPRKK